MSGSRTRSRNLQISLETLAGTTRSCSCSRSTAEQYLLAFTWIQRTSVEPNATKSNKPRLPPALRQVYPAASRIRRALCSARVPLALPSMGQHLPGPFDQVQGFADFVLLIRDA